MFVLIAVRSNDLPEQGQSVILYVNEQKIKRTLSIKSILLYDTKIICKENKHETVKIRFIFICGFEFQEPKVENKLCLHNVFNVNPEICDQKVCNCLRVFKY